MKTEEILAQRGSKYGEYFDNARTMQAIKSALRTGARWNELPDIVKETLEMLALKMGRIVNGDPLYDDNWRDIIGYTQLVLDRLDSAQIDSEARADPYIQLANRYGLARDAVKHAVLSLVYTPGAELNTDPTQPGAEGTEPKDASHAVDSEPRVPRQQAGVHLTDDHVGMYFRLADGNLSPVRLELNDGPEPERYRFKAHGKRYTEYGFVAGDDGTPLHDIVAFHPH